MDSEQFITLFTVFALCQMNSEGAGALDPGKVGRFGFLRETIKKKVGAPKNGKKKVLYIYIFFLNGKKKK